MQKFAKPSFVLFACLVLTFFLVACGSLPNSTPTPFATTAPTATTVPTATVAISVPTKIVPNISVAPPSTVTPVPTIPSQSNQVVLGGIPVNVYVPSGITTRQQAQLMVILHGMGGAGEPMLKPLMEYADQNKWILLAPTFRYNADWQNPKTVAQEDPRLAATLNQIVDEVPNYLGMPVKNQVLLYGFSRGAQLAHRYAIIYPERTKVVAVISAGSYTLPFENTNEAKLAGYLRLSDHEGSLAFPFGVGDLENYTGQHFDQAAFKKISFWVQVGQMDNKNSEVPRAYDNYIGVNRVERATNFYNALTQMGVRATLTVYPDVAHATTKEMQSKACNYFKTALQTKQAKTA
jgi:predicted esterase